MYSTSYVIALSQSKSADGLIKLQYSVTASMYKVEKPKGSPRPCFPLRHD